MINNKKIYTHIVIATIFGVSELLTIFAYNNFIANIKSLNSAADKDLFQLIALYLDDNMGKTFLLFFFGLLFLLFSLKAFNSYKNN